jgi:hypothetical protein
MSSTQGWIQGWIQHLPDGLTGFHLLPAQELNLFGPFCDSIGEGKRHTRRILENLE